MASHKFLSRMAQVVKRFWVVYKKCELLSILQLLTYISREEWGLGVKRVDRGQRRSYTNKYNWKLPAPFLKGFAGNVGTLEP